MRAATAAKHIARRVDDGIPIPTNLFIDTWDACTWRHIDRQEVHNLYVMAGRNLLRDALYGDPITGLTNFGVGEGTTEPKSSDEALEAEVYRDLITQMIKSDGLLTVKYYLPSGEANDYDLTEAGVFNAPTGGTMPARAIYDKIEKSTDIEVTYTWDFNIGAS